MSCRNWILTVFCFTLCRSVHALDPSCSWNLKNYFETDVIASIDPATIKALQDLLQRVAQNPHSPLSASDKLWAAEYHLDSAIKAVRESGAVILRKKRIKKWIGKSVKSVLVLTPSTLLTKIIVDYALGRIDRESDFRKKYAIDAPLGGADAEFEMLEKVIKCGGVTLNFSASRSNEGSENSLAIHASFLRAKWMTMSLILGQDFLEAAFGNSVAMGNIQSLYDKILEINEKTGIVLCTRWGTGVGQYFNPEEIEVLHKIMVTEASSELQEKFGVLKRIIKTDFRFQHGHNVTLPEFGSYSTTSKAFDYYLNRGAWPNPDLFPRYALLHEVAHAMNDVYQVSDDSAEWLRQIQAPDVWLPNPNLKSEEQKSKQPFEIWADAFACWYIQACQEEMGQKNPKMFQFLKEKIGG